MSVVLKNNAKSTLATSVNSTDTSLLVDDVSSFPALGVGEYFYATIESVSGFFEIVKVTGITGNTFAVERGAESTIAIPMEAGARIELRITVQNLDDHFSTVVGSVVGAAVSAALAIQIGTSIQPYDPDLMTWAGLSPSSFFQTLVPATDASAMRTLLGVTATGADTAYLRRASNLSDLGNATTARDNIDLGISDTVQFNKLLLDQAGKSSSFPWHASIISADVSAPVGVEDVVAIMGLSQGDNTTVKGLTTLRLVAQDRPGAVKGVLYPLRIEVSPLSARNNSPFDDADGIVVQNISGILGAMATDAYYVAASPSIGPGPAFYSAFTSNANVVRAIQLGGTISEYAIDLVNATLTTHVATRFPNLAQMVWRNAANSADLSILSVDASNNILLGGTGAGTVNVSNDIILIHSGSDSTVRVQGGSGYASFDAYGSGTNPAYLFLGNTTHGERVRITVGDTRTLFISADGGTTTHLGVLDTGYAFIANGLEIGHVNDTTLARASAGKIAVEGVAILDATNISDVAYNATSWDGVTTIAPSKNAVRDKIEALATLYQPLSTNLTTYAGVTPSANAQTLLGHTFAQMRTDLGLVIGTNVQAWDTDLDTWAAITRASGFDTFVATPSSANLKSLLTDETGSGSAVFATSPTLVTPILGTPTSGTLTNCTGLPASGISDYTATSYTPALSFGGGTTGITYSTQSGNYVQIGKLVFFNIGIVLTSKGSSTGTAKVTVPTNGAAQNLPGGIVAGYYANMVAAGTITGTVANGSNVVTLRTSGATGTTDMADTNFANNTNIYLYGMYYAA